MGDATPPLARPLLPPSVMNTRGLGSSALGVSLVFCGACTGPASGGDRDTAELAGAREPVLVVLGGFNSCLGTSARPTPVGSDRWDRAVRLSARFARTDSRWVRGCFDGAGRLHWISSAAPATVRTAPLDALEPFFAAVSERVGPPGRPVYLLGHSYGAWLAMFAVWSLAPSADVRLLVTVDPISPAHCSVASYLRAAASPASAPYYLAGCQRAPTDFTPEARRRIVGVVREGGWRHYYQRNFLPLRSGPFDGDGQPHRSYDLSAFLSHLGGVRPSWNAHTGIDALSVVWYTFEASIEHDLARD